MNKRTAWTLYIIVCLICSFVYLAIYMSWRKEQEEEAKRVRLSAERQAIQNSLNRIGAVELEPKSINYGRLNHILLEQGEFVPTSVYENAIDIVWYDGIIKARFFKNSLPSDSDVPIELELRNNSSTPFNFQGSIRGVRLGFSKEQAAVTMRQFGCNFSKPDKDDGGVDCNDSWHMYLSLQDGEIVGISIWDGRYAVIR